MKKNIVKNLFVLFIGVALFSSCIKKENGAEPIVKEPTKTLDLTVPDGFNWETSVSVSCDFKSTNNASTLVSLSLENDGESFATFYVGGGADAVSVSLPTYVEEVFVSYYKETGKSTAQKLVINGGKLSYTVPSDAKVYIDETPAPLRVAKYATRANDKDDDDDDDDDDGEKNPTITYPANGWGTIMFEDLFPSYGDYDFNDFVIGYKIKLHPKNKNKVKDIDIDMLIRAQGGSLPYEIYLRMLGVKGGEVDEIEIDRKENTNSGFDVVAINSNNPVKDPSIIKFVNMRQMNVGYVNTEKDNILTEDKLVRVSFSIELRNSVSVAPIGQDKYGLSAESFDFFIVKQDDGDDLREIHIGGIEPAINLDYYKKICSENPNTDKSKAFYLSNDNLVWGIKIPAPVAHSYEQIDIMKAYPDFAKWVQSGGNTNKDWYMKNVEDMVIGW